MDKFFIYIETPKPFGWLHILFIVLALAGTFCLSFFGRKFDEKKYKLALFICWIAFVVLEIYKQVTFCLTWDGWNVTGYFWNGFPYQFCASPLYVMPLAIFPKNKHIKEAATAFMMTFGLFGGLATYLFPDGVFCTRLTINIQSLTYHGLMIVVAVFMGIYNKEKINPLFFLKGILLFTAMLSIAVLMNETFHQVTGLDSYFDMYFISSHHLSVLPLLSAIDDKINPALAILLYYVVFSAIAAAILCLVYIFAKLIPDAVIKTSKKKQTQAA